MLYGSWLRVWSGKAEVCGASVEVRKQLPMPMHDAAINNRSTAFSTRAGEDSMIQIPGFCLSARSCRPARVAKDPRLIGKLRVAVAPGARAAKTAISAEIALIFTPHTPESLDLFQEKACF